MARVLVVDDSTTDQHVLCEILKKNGHEALTADTADIGIQQCRENSPELILMDVVMPGMNGFQATRVISKDPELKHIPIIIITTKDQETDRVWGMRQGAKDYLTKPVDEAELVKKVEAILKAA